MARKVNGTPEPDAATASLQNTDWKFGPGLRRRIRGTAVYALPILIVLLSAIAAPSLVSADAGRGYLNLGGGYKTGDFGTPTTSRLFHISPILGYVAPEYDFSVSVPYLYLTNKTSGQSVTESGAGDVILRGGAIFIPEGPGGISLNGSLALKLPTADEARGLGTGEADYGAFLGLHQRTGNVTFSLTGGYIKVGDPASFNFNDINLYGAGISRIFGNTNIAVSFEGRKSMVPGAEDPREASIGFFHVLNAEYAVRGSVFKGLNNGGPNTGMDFGVVRWF